MDVVTPLYFKGRSEWRKWLEENHETTTEVWVVFFKKHVKVQALSYDEAVEEALCFGWIDSTIKRIDSERYMHRFTPRRSTKNWSEKNKKRALKMITEGRMTKAGFKKLPASMKVMKDG